ncbi:STAS domain-containing protein [Saccharothrix yanglingensis]|uniref:Anti-sigma factor antagonist n=1 Tax=Saccharothrix yanglingensis TaxID=659496 RepID=A0ABU0X4T5_9PSEU|nr:STAS domain-containing protein [Saccharothrix yanglingensis]MDQ2586607.1 anti-anti-sigma factor [Saccharothrix yanglingensis]
MGRSGGAELSTTTRRLDDDVVVLAASGEIDTVTVAALRDPLLELAGRAAAGGTVVADLAGIGFFSSPGIEALLTAHQRLRAAGATLRVVTAPIVRRTLALVGLQRELALHDTLDDALAAVGDRHV